MDPASRGFCVLIEELVISFGFWFVRERMFHTQIDKLEYNVYYTVGRFKAYVTSKGAHK